jgi:hypothetical protein
LSDDGHAVSYKVLPAGTPVWSADGVEIGHVRAVLENAREHIFDGLVVDTPGGPARAIEYRANVRGRLGRAWRRRR